MPVSIFKVFQFRYPVFGTVPHHARDALRCFKLAETKLSNRPTIIFLRLNIYANSNLM